MIGYVAKDKNGKIYLHMRKPYHDDYFEEWFSNIEVFDITGQFSEFDNMSYDDEPIKVEIKLEKI